MVPTGRSYIGGPALMLAIFISLFIAPANAYDFTLGIYGNADMDDVIDEEDLEYAKGIINGSNAATGLADANRDGEIDEDDLAQIEKIIAGEESEMTILDTARRDVTIPKPVERIVVPSGLTAEAFMLLGATDSIVGVSDKIKEKTYFFSEISDRPSVGGWQIEDYEAIASLDPDIVISYEKWPPIDEAEEKLESFGIPVIVLEFTDPDIIAEELQKLGYILDRRGEADDYLDWRSSYEEDIESLVGELEEDDRPRTFLETTYKGAGDIGTYSEGSSGNVYLALCGGRNIAANMSVSYPHVDSEWLITENPDVIIKYVYSSTLDWGWNGTEDPQAILDEVKSRDGWDNIEVVKNGRVYLISNELMTGLDSIVGYLYWTKMLHPEFSADPDGAYEEYLTEFLGIEYPDLIFGYPLPD